MKMWILTQAWLYGRSLVHVFQRFFLFPKPEGIKYIFITIHEHYIRLKTYVDV